MTPNPQSNGPDVFSCIITTSTLLQWRGSTVLQCPRLIQPLSGSTYSLTQRHCSPVRPLSRYHSADGPTLSVAPACNLVVPKPISKSTWLSAHPLGNAWASRATMPYGWLRASAPPARLANQPYKSINRQYRLYLRQPGSLAHT